MDWTAPIRSALTSTRLPDDDVVEELAQHARAMYDAARADGCSPDEADVRVREQIDRWQLEAATLRHPSRRPPLVEPPPAASASGLPALLQDVLYAARLLWRRPRHAVIVSLTMAVGIAATTTLFSVMYGVLIKPVPWPDADRLVVLEETRGGRTPRFGAFSNASYLAWASDAATITGIAAWAQRTATLAGAGDPERIRVTTATASLFPLLDATPLAGTLFGQDDELEKHGPVVVLAERLWRQQFGGDPGVIGGPVRIDGRPHTVIGVLPDRSAFPDRQTHAWVPFRVIPTTGNYLSMFNAMARLRPGVTPAQAAAEGTARGEHAADTGMTTLAVFGGAGPIRISATPLRRALTADVRRPLVLLLAAVSLLLIAGTANVASLQAAHATTRTRELAIQSALGASGVRLTRQLLVESTLPGIIGGAAGLVAAWLLHQAVPSVLPADFPRLDELGMNAAVVLFAVVVSVSTSIVAGLLPALRVRRVNLVESLAQDGMGAIGAGARSRAGRMRMLLMTGQVAIACVLLVGASLLGRSFVGLLTVDRGYEPSGLLTARLSLPATAYTPVQRYAIVRRILDRLEGLPGVADAGFTSELPLNPGGSTSAFTIPSRHTDGGVAAVRASPRIVSARSFAALGMRVIAGRGFDQSDTDTSLPVAVVNRSFARQYLGESPLGATLPMGAGYQDRDAVATVIGVADDVRYPTAIASTQPEIFYCFRQFEGRLEVPVVTLLVKATGDPAALGPSLRAAVREADASLVADAVTTMEDRLLATLARPRLYAALFAGFATVALVVAAVGLFGMLTCTVTLRSRELALRMALGARPGDIIRLVLRQTLALTAAGLAAGLTASFALMRSAGSLLYGVTPGDAVTYVAVAVVLVVTAAGACVVPVRRAARLNPVEAMKATGERANR
jgi:putative ABC transport system permease protein